MSSARIFGGRWEVVTPLDEGGQSYVYKVRDRNGEFTEELILKRLKNLKRLDRFEREIKSCQQLSHSGIAPILAYSFDDPPFFVTKFYEGGPLTTHAPFPPIQALDLFIQLCNIVSYAHKKGVIHRDLKPDNIVLNRDRSPVIIDFGLCYLQEEDQRITATMEQVGSRFYIAPELEQGHLEKVTYRVDSYALGKILYFLLAGRNIAREAFRGDNDLTKVCNNEQLNYVSDRILAYAVVENPDDRKSVAELGREARDVRRLIIEHYYPGTEGSLCRFCGEGHYGKFTKSTIRLREPGIEHSVDFYVLVCDKCRNVEWFRFPEGR
ncbi:MAG: serine/threonine protein kinase [Syntrophaceae bacterium]|nr:serine/threonine protein kinase [Syntrophaceae bacterium]